MLFTFDGYCGFLPRLTLCRPVVTVGSSRPGVNHYYIKDRFRGTSDPPRVYIEAPKASFQKTVLIIDLSVRHLECMLFHRHQAIPPRLPVILSVG
jgi:hypothetical protein